MKKIIMLFICSLLSIQISFSQTCQWAEKAHNNSGTYNSYISVDISGFINCVGYYSTLDGSATTFNNGVKLSGKGSYLAKYNSSGACQWAKCISESSTSIFIFRISTDSQGNIYTVDASFITKYNSNGDSQWATKISAQKIVGMSIDGTGNVYIAGCFNSNIIFNNGIKLSASGASDGFIAKYNSSGICQWAEKIGGAKSDYTYSIAVDSKGSTYVTGAYNSKILYFNNSKQISGDNDTIYYNSYIAKYNSNGTCQWVQKIRRFFWFGPMGTDIPDFDHYYYSSSELDYKFSEGFTLYKYFVTTYPIRLAVDGFDNIFATGVFKGNINFNNGISLTSDSGQFNDVFVVKYNSYGICRWAQKVGGPGNEYSCTINADNFGNVYVGGFYSQITNFNNGISLSTGYEYPYAYSDSYIAKFNSYGECQWAERIYMDNNLDEPFQQIALARTGDFYLAGSFEGKLNFNNNVSISTHYYDWNAVTDAFLAKYSQPPPISINTLSVSPLSFCQGGEVSVPFSISGVFKDENIFVAQLSDSLGNFANPIRLGILQGAKPGTIKAVIPASTPAGTHYRIRVISMEPMVKGIESSEDITIYALPSKYNVTGGGTYCNGDAGVPVGLSGSQSGISYQLKINGVITGEPVIGTGDSISFGNNTSSSTYTVVATTIGADCVQEMNGYVDITINPPPFIMVIGTLTVCENNIYHYRSNNALGFSKKWSITGGKILSDSSASDIDVQWDANGQGTITLYQQNDTTGCDAFIKQNVTINPLPKNPIITENTKILSSSPAIAYHWYFENDTIPGANKQSYKPEQNGNYKVKITDSNGCSNMSEAYYFDITGVEVTVVDKSNLEIIPNPAFDLIEIVGSNSISPFYNFDIQIYNILGECVKKHQSSIISATLNEWQGAGVIIDISGLPAGIYMLKCGNEFGKFVKE